MKLNLMSISCQDLSLSLSRSSLCFISCAWHYLYFTINFYYNHLSFPPCLAMIYLSASKACRKRVESASKARRRVYHTKKFAKPYSLLL